MTTTDTDRSSSNGRGRNWPFLLVLSLLGLALLWYGGTSLVESLKPPDHLHSEEDSPEAAKKARLAEVKRLEEALAADPSNASAMTELGGLYLLEEEYASARKWFTRARDLDGRNVRALTGLGNAYRLSGDVGRGLALLRESAAVDPTFPETWLLLGVVYRFEKNDPDSARWAWGKFLRLEPSGMNAERVKSELRSLAKGSASPAG